MEQDDPKAAITRRMESSARTNRTVAVVCLSLAGIQMGRILSRIYLGWEWHWQSAWFLVWMVIGTSRWELHHAQKNLLGVMACLEQSNDQADRLLLFMKSVISGHVVVFHHHDEPKPDEDDLH